MPEILEVEAYRRGASRAVGRHFGALWVLDAHCLSKGTDAGSLAAVLRGARLEAARRRGKLLVLDTTGGRLGIHFSMAGGLVVDGSPVIDRLLYGPPSSEERWVRLRAAFQQGGGLALHDPRRLARVALDPDEEALGPDALALTGAQLAGALRPERASRGPGPALKAALLDQRRLAGLGNLLVDEVLWRAKLSPLRPAGALGDAQIAGLQGTIRSTLTQLAQRGGSHTGDLVPARRPGGRCPSDGAALARQVVGGRTTFWCPRHQR